LGSYEAAITGGFLHGAAAELTGVSSGLLAGEISDWVPDVIKSLS
jgi:NAD(P)H-hydrate repair Nnr-like enzyme with NAD(P)H-hydrate dehydratase domain